MKKNLFAFLLLMSVLTGFAQTVTLTFSGRDANNLSSNNSTGFSVLPAASAPFASLYFGYASYFWTTTATDSDTVYFWYLLNQDSGVYKRDEDKYFGNSVRCLKN